MLAELFSQIKAAVCSPQLPSQEGTQLLCSLQERAGFTGGYTMCTCVLQTQLRSVGFSSHACRRWARQPCLLLCDVVLQGKPQNTAALATSAGRQKSGQFIWKDLQIEVVALHSYCLALTAMKFAYTCNF